MMSSAPGAKELTVELLENGEQGNVRDSDSGANVATRDLMDSLEESDKTLLSMLNTPSHYFLALCGMVWDSPRGLITAWMCRVWSFCVLAEVGYCYGGESYQLLQHPGVSQKLCIPIAAALLLQLVGILVGTQHNSRRLWTKCRKYEPTAFSSSLRVTILLALVLSVITMLQYKLDSFVVGVAYVVPCFVLAANVYFLLVDASVCQQILRECVAAANDGRLTTDMVSVARAEISDRIETGFVANTAIMATALANKLAIFVIVIIVPDGFVGTLFDIIGFLMREVVIAIVGLWSVALVNEEYDKLVFAAGSIAHEATGSNKHLDNSLVLNLLTCPINFPLAGMTLRRKELLLRFSIWLFGILLSVATKSL
jgi:hypothetical protein